MRRLKRLVVFLVLLVAVCIGGAAYFSDGIIREAVQVAGTQSLGVEMTVGDIDLGWVRDSCEINDIAVGNPKGFQADKFLEVGRISLAQAVPSFLSDEITVPRLEIAGINVFLETDGSKTNFDPIIRSIQGASAPVSSSSSNLPREEAAPAPSKTESNPNVSGGGKQLTIQKLVLSDLHVSCIVHTPIGEAVPIELDIPRIELDNLRSDDTSGSLTDNVGSIVLTVLSVVQQTVQSQLPGAIARSLTASLDGLAGKVPLLGGMTEQLVSKAAPIMKQIESITSAAGGELSGGVGDLAKEIPPAAKAKAEKAAKKAAKDAEKALRGLLGGRR